MIFVGIGVVIEVVMIGVGEMGRSVERLWMGDEVIWVSEMRLE